MRPTDKFTETFVSISDVAASKHDYSLCETQVVQTSDTSDDTLWKIVGGACPKGFSLGSILRCTTSGAKVLLDGHNPARDMADPNLDTRDSAIITQGTWWSFNTTATGWRGC